MLAALNRFSGDWLRFIVDSSLQLAVFFVIVSFFCWLARKRSARFLHVLWLFFLIKILIPPSISLPISLPQQPQIIPHFSLPAITISAESGASSGLSLSGYLFMAWLLVTAGMLGFFLVKNISFRLSLKKSVLLEDKRLPSSWLTETKGGNPLKVKVYLTGHICSPFAVNLFKPRIYLPTHSRDWSEKQLEAVLLHELAHIERKDLWVGLLQNLTQIVYFFHPMVWAANRQIVKYRERACDDLVISRTHHRALEYSKLLLNSIDQMLQLTKCPTLINGFRQKQKALIKRFEYLINRKEDLMNKIKPGERMVLVLVCVFAFMLSVLSYASKNRMTGDIISDMAVQVKSELKIKKYDAVPQPLGGLAEFEKNLIIPETLKDKQISGTAVFYVRFDVGGKILETITAKTLDKILDRILLDAIKGTRWTPVYLNKKPVPAVVQIPVHVKTNTDGSHTITLGNLSNLSPPPPPLPAKEIKVDAVPTPVPPLASPPQKVAKWDKKKLLPPPTLKDAIPLTSDVKTVGVAVPVEVTPPLKEGIPLKSDAIELKLAKPIPAPPPPPPAKGIKADVAIAPVPSPAPAPLEPAVPLPAEKVKAIEVAEPVTKPMPPLKKAIPAKKDIPAVEVAPMAAVPVPPPVKAIKADVAIAPAPPPPAQKVKGSVSIETLPGPEGGLEAINKHLTLPEAVKRQLKHNEAIIKVLVDAKGHVKDAEVVYRAPASGVDDEVRKKVENAVLAALKQIKWKAATQAGKPIAAWIKFTLKFD